ncbi:hypothetical protein BCR33DRAFT_724900 [Rhizoclosmatium globosum]|uniref:Ig-like domain-containing protein n=1 Tax=Rhizoclosmatium globosum TaxID=329046 RepID=A0A1Y2B2C7_9FUNG|nr:hypothetical protein BCR33DRAFT_724900 [Rhizoclosmatium globosum]|eukprot:ORY28710.1 hypothetical protein BCR33DRAFT_724900 [Rhizoclosmatium globosum]
MNSYMCANIVVLMVLATGLWITGEPLTSEPHSTSPQHSINAFLPLLLAATTPQASMRELFGRGDGWVSFPLLLANFFSGLPPPCHFEWNLNWRRSEFWNRNLSQTSRKNGRGHEMDTERSDEIESFKVTCVSTSGRQIEAKNPPTVVGDQCLEPLITFTWTRDVKHRQMISERPRNE